MRERSGQGNNCDGNKNLALSAAFMVVRNKFLAIHHLCFEQQAFEYLR